VIMLIITLSSGTVRIFQNKYETVCAYTHTTAADSHLMKLQRLKNRILCAVGNLPCRTPTHAFPVAFHIPYVYDLIAKLCMEQAEVIQNHDNVNVRNIGKGEAQHRTIKTQTWWRSGIRSFKCLSCC